MASRPIFACALLHSWVGCLDDPNFPLLFFVMRLVCIDNLDNYSFLYYN